MDCESCRSWLHAYADNELDTGTAARIATHLGECPECRRRYDDIVALRTAVRERAPYFAAPAGLGSSVLAAIRAETRQDSRTWFGRCADLLARAARGWLAPALSAALVTAVVVLQVTVPSNRERLLEEAVSSHVRSLMADHLTDVASSDRHTVKPWFAGKLTYAPAVEDLARAGFPLVGGRLDYLREQAVAALVYRRNRHVINVFVVPANDAHSFAGVESVRGYNVATWRRDQIGYIAVSDLNTAELETFAALMRR